MYAAAFSLSIRFDYVFVTNGNHILNLNWEFLSRGFPNIFWILFANLKSVFPNFVQRQQLFLAMLENVKSILRKPVCMQTEKVDILIFNIQKL